VLIKDANGCLQAAAPCYLKPHSYGEFVFDFAWARAAEAAGIRYYPKAVTAVPFVPSTGPKLGASSPHARNQLLAALMQPSASGWHGLFLPPDEAAAAQSAGALLRHDVQFHWQNQGYPQFEDFLAALTADKRKKIKQERKRLTELGLSFAVRHGSEFDADTWSHLYALYANTYEERGQSPYLSLEFFLDYARRGDSPVRVAIALQNGAIIAMALLLQAGARLYGRHWGSAVAIPGLHFELCYYQGLEYCIAQGLSHYDAGTQGEHKLARGFDPVFTTSAHYLQHPGLRHAVARHLQQEGTWQQQRLIEYQSHSAYRQEPRPSP